MKIRLNHILIIIAGAFMIACSSKPAGSEKKKEKLHDLKQQMVELKKEINMLEEELIKEDSSYALEKDKSILVETIKVNPKKFFHKIQIRGTVSSNRNVQISAEAMAKIVKVFVSEGQYVKQGQMLLELDAKILRNNIQELKTSLELATTMYDKQKNLWEKNIGTEVQFLQAKNQKESLEKKLNTAYAQLDNYMIKAPFNGQINSLDVKKGEMMSPGMPICRLVSLEDMHIQADLSERFIGTFKVKDSVLVEFPSLNTKIMTTISSIGKVINEQNRTFRIEVKLPEQVSQNARPNQLAVLTMTDYVNTKALIVPSKIVQKDARGNYIYVTGKGEEGLVAKKQHVNIGKSYNEQTEILQGLKAKEEILTAGYRDVADGTLIKINS